MKRVVSIVIVYFTLLTANYIWGNEVDEMQCTLTEVGYRNLCNRDGGCTQQHSRTIEIHRKYLPCRFDSGTLKPFFLKKE